MGAYTTSEGNSRFVKCPYDEDIDRRDGIASKRRRSTPHVEDGMVMSFADAVIPEVVSWW